MKAKILIAEDDGDLLDVYRMMLEEQYEIIEARNGREAVELFSMHDPSLVLMDIRMPVMNGDEAITEIISTCPTARIVAVTAFNHSSDQLGVPVLRKGFSREEFLKKIEESLVG